MTNAGATLSIRYLKSVAIFQAILGIYGMSLYSMRLLYLPSNVNFAVLKAAKGVFLTGLCVSFIAFILALVLLKGAQQANFTICKTWLYCQIILILHTFVQIVAAIGGVGRELEDTADLMHNLLPLLLQMYFIITVAKIVGEMKKGEHYEPVQ